MINKKIVSIEVGSPSIVQANALMRHIPLPLQPILFSMLRGVVNDAGQLDLVALMKMEHLSEMRDSILAVLPETLYLFSNEGGEGSIGAQLPFSFRFRDLISRYGKSILHPVASANLVDSVQFEPPIREHKVFKEIKGKMMEIGSSFRMFCYPGKLKAGFDRFHRACGHEDASTFDFDGVMSKFKYFVAVDIDGFQSFALDLSTPLIKEGFDAILAEDKDIRSD